MGADAWFGALEDIRLDLLSVYGRSYVIEHCMASLVKEKHRKNYEIYITDMLKSIVEIQLASHDVTPEVPGFTELSTPPKEEETADDVIARITRNLMG